MKTLAFITTNDERLNQFQYDKILTALTFDWDVIVVFMNAGFETMIENKIWRSLSLYGTQNVYYLGPEKLTKDSVAVKIKHEQLMKLIEESGVIL
jgi:hypothetical protein